MKRFYKILLLKIFLISLLFGGVYWYQDLYQVSIPQDILGKSCLSSGEDAIISSDFLFEVEDDEDEDIKKDFHCLRFQKLSFEYSVFYTGEAIVIYEVIPLTKLSFYLNRSDLSPPCFIS